MVVRILGLLLLLVVSGCVAHNQQPIMSVEDQADMTCRSYGAKPGTPEYIKCRTDAVQGDMNRMNAARIQCQNQRAYEDVQPSTVVSNGIVMNTRSPLADAMRPRC